MLVNPESKSKWFTDINKRHYLLQKSNLIDLFTIADLPIVEHSSGKSPNNRNIGDIVNFSEYGYTGYNFRNIPHNKQSHIYITLYGASYGTYEIDKIYVSSNIAYKVVNIQELSSLQDHPYLNELSQEEKVNISQVSTYQVVFLEKVPVLQQYKGYDLFTDKEYVFGIDYTDIDEPKYIVLSKYGEPAFSIYERLTLHKDDIENFTNTTSIVTTYGRYIANYFSLANPFGSVIPYMNQEISIPDIESIIAEKIRNGELTTEQGGKYLDNTFFIGSFGEMAIPGLTKKSLVTSPEVKKKKKELLEKHKNQLNDPIILAQIEDELIKLDKEWLKGDPSMGFYGDTSKKFNVHRKKQYLIGGVIEDFTKEKGKYEFVENSLSDGWSIDSFVTICNEIRNGSYSRGLETAAGGTLSKNILRLMQNLSLTAEDCGTKEYLEIVLTKELSKKFIGRYILDNGKLVALSKDNLNNYIDKKIKIRSLMYCRQKDGYCHKCAGEFFRNLGQDVIGVLALELTSVFTKLSLKKMHGIKISTEKINSLNKFVV